MIHEQSEVCVMGIVQNARSMRVPPNTKGCGLHVWSQPVSLPASFARLCANQSWLVFRRSVGNELRRDLTIEAAKLKLQNSMNAFR